MTSWESEGIDRAHERIKDHIFQTPLIYSPHLSSSVSKLFGGSSKIYLKLESEQLTGSFKARGAYNKIIQLKDEGKDFITASTGISSLFNYTMYLYCY
jgi:threonine dehydratase